MENVPEITRKKKVLLHSNYAGAKTGFGGFMREIMFYLHATGKYDLYLYAAGVTFNNPDFARWPWKTFGALPNSEAEYRQAAGDENSARGIAYGSYYIDRVIAEVKPDVYIPCEDIWGFADYRFKRWWNKFPCVVHTTLDSRPILPVAYDVAKSTPHFYSWADFATQEMNKNGAKHVKTLRGTVNTKQYYRTDPILREEVRKRFNIPEDAFCVGMLSRNQLRKSFPNLIEGYAKFKSARPDIKNTRLLFFTHFGEGWNISRICKEYGVPVEEVLAAYKCRATGEWFCQPYTGQDINNPVTGHKGSMVTANTQDGLTEEQICEWYNILDVYAHPFTSGGQERSIQEAKLCELITLVTNYSCGEDSCEEGAGSLPLAYSEYREMGTEFIKASTDTKDIAEKLVQVYEMNEQQRRKLGAQGREWVLKNFSLEVIGGQFEKILDALPFTDYAFDFQTVENDVNAQIPEISDNREWLATLHSAIFKRDVSSDDESLNHWVVKLETGQQDRKTIEEQIRKTAAEENAKIQKKELNAMLPEKPDDRLLITMPESLGDCINLTSLLRDARERYPSKKIFVATKKEYIDVFLPIVGKYIDYVVDWHDVFDKVYELEGYAGNEKVFDIVLSAHHNVQRPVNYIHNNHDKSEINLKYPPFNPITPQ